MTHPKKSVGVAVYGENGHQILQNLPQSPSGRLVATAGLSPKTLASIAPDSGVIHHSSLEALLADPNVELVSLCSPFRRDQAGDALRALRAGKHVYAEKPCALEESELDALIRTSQETGCLFREMAGTAFEQPYRTMRDIVRKGLIGEVVQVISEKSYPYYEGRPQDEGIDGGLICQNAIHALRFVEHVAGMRVASVAAMETSLGNPVPEGGLRMASTLMLRLENGGLASIAANYLNPRGTGVWGNETLRILGTLGMVESTNGKANTRLVIGDKDHGPLNITEPDVNYLETFLRTILGEAEMPMTLEEELRPTRWGIRAKANLL